MLVARAMGHKDLSTTERYVQLDESVLRESVEKMFR
jgi:site-specific recombinase XerD